jgi:hypothetical protein
MKKRMVLLAASGNEAVTALLASARKMPFRQTNVAQPFNRYKLLSFLLEFVTLLHSVAVFATEEALDLGCPTWSPVLLASHRPFS